jgi:hypothetical protein
MIVYSAVVLQAQTKTEVYFDPIVDNRPYDGTDGGKVRLIRFRNANTGDVVEGFEPYDGINGNYNVVSVKFITGKNVTNYDLDTVEVEIIKIQDKPIYNTYELKALKCTTYAKIEKAKGFISVKCSNIVYGDGAKPQPIIDSSNIVAKELWSNPTWLSENVTFRYALMNMGIVGNNEPEQIPAYFRDVPDTQGKYWVQAILKESQNYTGDTSRAEPFEISPQDATQIKGIVKKSGGGGFFIKQNPVVGDNAEFLLNVSQNSFCELAIYDFVGDVICNFAFQVSGNQSIKWDLRNKNGRKVADGAYLAVAAVKELNTGKVYSYKTLIAVKNK